MAATEGRSLAAALVASTLLGCIEPWVGALVDIPEKGTGVWFVPHEGTTSIVELDRDDPSPFADLTLPRSGHAELWFYGCGKQKLGVPSPADPPLPNVSSGQCGAEGVAPCPFAAYQLEVGASRLDPIELRPTTPTRQPWPRNNRPMSECAGFGPVLSTAIPDIESEFAEQTVLAPIGDRQVLLVTRDRKGSRLANVDRSVLQVWQVSPGGGAPPAVISSTITRALWIGGTSISADRVFLVGNTGQTTVARFDGSAISLEPGPAAPIVPLRCRGGCGSPACGGLYGVEPCYRTCIADNGCLTNEGLELQQRDLCVEDCVRQCGDLDAYQACVVDPIGCVTQPSSFKVEGTSDDLWIADACGGLLHQADSGPWEVVHSTTTAEINLKGAGLTWLEKGEVYAAGVSVLGMLHYEGGRLRTEPFEGQVTTAVVQSIDHQMFGAGFFPAIGASIYERSGGNWSRLLILGTEEAVGAFHSVAGGLLISVPASGGLFQMTGKGLCPPEAVPAIPSTAIATHFLAIDGHHVVVLAPIIRGEGFDPARLGVFDVLDDDRCDQPP